MHVGFLQRTASPSGFITAHLAHRRSSISLQKDDRQDRLSAEAHSACITCCFCHRASVIWLYQSLPAPLCTCYLSSAPVLCTLIQHRIPVRRLRGKRSKRHAPRQRERIKKVCSQETNRGREKLQRERRLNGETPFWEFLKIPF